MRLSRFFAQESEAIGETKVQGFLGTDEYKERFVPVISWKPFERYVKRSKVQKEMRIILRIATGMIAAVGVSLGLPFSAVTANGHVLYEGHLSFWQKIRRTATWDLSFTSAQKTTVLFKVSQRDGTAALRATSQGRFQVALSDAEAMANTAVEGEKLWINANSSRGPTRALTRALSTMSLVKARLAARKWLDPGLNHLLMVTSLTGHGLLRRNLRPTNRSAHNVTLSPAHLSTTTFSASKLRVQNAPNQSSVTLSKHQWETLTHMAGGHDRALLVSAMDSLLRGGGSFSHDLAVLESLRSRGVRWSRTVSLGNLMKVSMQGQASVTDETPRTSSPWSPEPQMTRNQPSTVIPNTRAQAAAHVQWHVNWP